MVSKKERARFEYWKEVEETFSRVSGEAKESEHDARQY